MSGALLVRRANWKLIGILALVAAIVAVLAPIEAEGSHGGPPVTGDTSIVYLTLQKQTDEVTWNGQTQSITTRKNDCTAVSFGSSPQLLDVTAINGVLGENDDYMGVQGPGDGEGEPCIRAEAADLIEDSEGISVSLGSALDGYLMTGVDFDTELKFNGIIAVEFFHGTSLVGTDSFNPTNSSDDGPDSKDGNNYRYYFEQSSVADENKIYFDKVVFTAQEGSFSLGGGSDLTNNDDANAYGFFDPTSHSTQIEVVQAFDGEITCGDTEIISDPDVPSVVGAVTLHVMDAEYTGDPADLGDPDPEFGVIDKGSGAYPPPVIEWNDDTEAELAPCVLKPYLAALAAVDVDDGDGIVNESELTFIPELTSTVARYTMEINVYDQEVTTVDGVITSLQAEYNPAGSVALPGTTGLPSCNGQPPADGDAAWLDQDLGLLPAGHLACYYHASVTITGTNSDGDTVGDELWRIFFLDDPGLAWK